jgi:hypothetical protein
MDECPPTWAQVDPAIAVEELESLSDGDPADAEAARQLRFDQMLPRGEGAVDDEVFERPVDLLAERWGPLQRPYRPLRHGCAFRRSQDGRPYTEYRLGRWSGPAPTIAPGL